MSFFTPFKVGLVTLAGIVAFVFVIGQVKEGTGRDPGVRVYAVFKDASGLVKKSRVQIAGINVGEIDDIELAGDMAKVWIRVTTPLHDDAGVMKKQASLLGDYYLQLYPGTGDKLLVNGDRIPKVIEDTGPTALLARLETIADDISRVTGAVEGVLGGDEGKRALQEFVDNVNATTRAIKASVADNQDQFDSIVGDVAAITSEVRQFTGPAGRSVSGILREVASIVHQVNTVVGESSGDAADSLSTLRGTLSKLQASLDSLNEASGNIASITRKIDEGSGTLGRLVNDDHLAQELDTMVEDAGDFVHTLTGMQTQVGLRSEYNFGLNSLKNYVSLRFQPREDKYYLLEIVDDPRGSTSVVRRTLESSDPGAHQLTHEQETITTDELKFSLQFAKEYHFLTGRFGIIEGAGGFGGNARMFDDQLDVAADIFDFGNDENPRLRVRLAYEFFRRMYVVGGLDDMFNFRTEQPGETFFFGASLRFTDDDLKALLTTIPAPSL